jgi:hypothetical protein
MDYHDGYNKYHSQRAVRLRNADGPTQSHARPDDGERLRIGRMACRACYPCWQFSVDNNFALIAFRPHPQTSALQKVGPWPLPEDAGEDEVREACLAAVVQADGEDARERFTWLPPK